MRLQICKSCWSKDTGKSAPKWKTIQLLLMQLKSANPANLKIHENKDQNENNLVALIHKVWHFGLKKHEGKCKFRLLGMSHWPDSLQLGKPTRCFLSWIFCTLVQVVVACCCLLCVVYKYCWAIWICFSQMFHMLLQKILKKSPVWVHPCFQTLDVEHL